MLDKQKLYDVLDFINQYGEENGFPPTVRDICRELGIKSTATAYSYLNRLNDMGLLNKAENKKRAVTLKSGDTVKVPLIGTVTAGQPIFAVENFDGYYTLPSAEFGGDDLYMLRVQGDSMIEAGIFDGDKIVVRKQESADNGDIVVAMFDDGIDEGATVKRYFRRDGKIILHPENSTMTDFVLDKVTILGKVIGLLRSM
ncbi:MAG: transcriptional repressor LexA [Clostridia bacterium]|jgi:repressor LexA|nr:transcriptional repressor LexA [Clostridia bacterium]